MLYGVPPNRAEEGSYYLQAISAGLQKTLLAVGNKDADAISIAVANTLDAVEQLELLQAPGLPYSVPAAYGGLPRLTGVCVWGGWGWGVRMYVWWGVCMCGGVDVWWGGCMCGVESMVGNVGL